MLSTFVTFPDFPGCVTQGDTVEQALARAAEALAFHLEDGADLPLPSAPDEVVKNREGEMLVMVTVADPRRRERINTTVAAGELAKIDWDRRRGSNLNFQLWGTRYARLAPSQPNRTVRRTGVGQEYKC